MSFDASALTEPVDRRAVRAHTAQLRSEGRLGRSSSVALIAGVAIGAVFLVIFGTVFLSIAVSILSGFASAGAPSWTLPALLVIGIGAGTAAVVMAQRRTGDRRYRLDTFARANGMAWYSGVDNPPLPGMIFRIGRARHSRDVVRGERPRLVEFGNYSYETGSGKNRSTSHWGYVAVKLATPLPHIVLDARGNNGLFGSNLPAFFDKDQRLSLEGDFDRYFTLSCPAGYERDALYLFTPDIMARFIDNAAALDVEIVDDWLFLYTKRPVSTLDPGTWAWLFSVVGALLDKLAQWERWRDDRLASASAPASAPASTSGATQSTDAASAGLPFAAPPAALRPPPGVAQEGRRLRTSVPIWVWIGGGLMVLFWLLTQTGALGFVLSGLR